MMTAAARSRAARTARRRGVNLMIHERATLASIEDECHGLSCRDRRPLFVVARTNPAGGKMKTLIASLSILLTGISVSAQQRPPVDAPGERHAALRRFIGEWEAQGRMWRSADSSVPPLEGKVTLSAQMVMGGRFLVERMRSQPPSRPFESVRAVGYDNLSGRYEGATYDSRGTNIILQVGQVNAVGELVLNYNYTDLGTGAPVRRRTVRKVISANEWIETAFETHGGSERKVTEIRARKKR